MDLILVAAGFAFVVLVVLLGLVLRAGRKSEAAVDQEVADEQQQEGGPNARNRMLRRRRVPQPNQDEDADGDDATAQADDPDGKKTSARQAAKQAMKAQRRAEAEEREAQKLERRKEDEQFWASREQERKKELDEAAKRAEEEKRLEEEMEKRDQAVFDQWKGMIEVEDSGSAIKTEQQLQQEAEELIATLKRDKVVLLESLALQWDMSGAQVAERLTELEEQGRIQGVLDERGNYIYVTDEELAAIGKWVQRKGRVKLSALAAHSNTLVRLTATQ